MANTSRIGIMQGRLLPPVDRRVQAFPGELWPREFGDAKRLGFDAIEFIFDGDLERHPLTSLKGLDEVRALIGQTQVAVESVCGDYFMSHPLHGVGKDDVTIAIRQLGALISGAADIGASCVVLPCVDQASLRSRRDEDELLRALEAVIARLERSRVTLALETDLGPDRFARLLSRCPNLIGVNYDTGNSASLGFDPNEEFDAYGARVVSVHVKDRRLRGPTVWLGTGAADFTTCFGRLARLDYSGPLTVQGARATDDHACAAAYLAMVRACMTEANGPRAA